MKTQVRFTEWYKQMIFWKVIFPWVNGNVYEKSYVQITNAEMIFITYDYLYWTSLSMSIFQLSWSYKLLFCMQVIKTMKTIRIE